MEPLENPRDPQAAESVAAPGAYGEIRGRVDEAAPHLDLRRTRENHSGTRRTGS